MLNLLISFGKHSGKKSMPDVLVFVCMCVGKKSASVLGGRLRASNPCPMCRFFVHKPRARNRCLICKCLFPRCRVINPGSNFPVIFLQVWGQGIFARFCYSYLDAIRHRFHAQLANFVFQTRGHDIHALSLRSDLIFWILFAEGRSPIPCGRHVESLQFAFQGSVF